MTHHLRARVVLSSAIAVAASSLFAAAPAQADTPTTGAPSCSSEKEAVDAAKTPYVTTASARKDYVAKTLTPALQLRNDERGKLVAAQAERDLVKPGYLAARDAYISNRTADNKLAYETQRVTYVDLAGKVTTAASNYVRARDAAAAAVANLEPLDTPYQAARTAYRTAFDALTACLNPPPAPPAITGGEVFAQYGGWALRDQPTVTGLQPNQSGLTMRLLYVLRDGTGRTGFTAISQSGLTASPEGTLTGPGGDVNLGCQGYTARWVVTDADGKTVVVRDDPAPC